MSIRIRCVPPTPPPPLTGPAPPRHRGSSPSADPRYQPVATASTLRLTVLRLGLWFNPARRSRREGGTWAKPRHPSTATNTPADTSLVANGWSGWPSNFIKGVLVASQNLLNYPYRRTNRHIDLFSVPYNSAELRGCLVRGEPVSSDSLGNRA